MQLGQRMSNFIVSEVLEHDHDAIDAEFQRFREGLERGEWLDGSFGRAAEALRHHIYVEEEALFPVLRVGGLVAPVFVMLREHAEIWQALDAIEAGAGRDTARALYAMASMIAVLEPHNSKEEQILYPASGQVLNTDDTEAIRRAFEESERPQGWVPMNLRR
jgi:iron-sulfur cluster repair protein YtfE (RIC family)